MFPTIDFGQALAALREGARVARLSSFPDGHNVHRSFVLIKGREIEASFPPMVDHLGKGTKFWVNDHIDAIFKYPEGDLPIATVVGFNFSQDDILATDWMIVED